MTGKFAAFVEEHPQARRARRKDMMDGKIMAAAGRLHAMQVATIW